MELYPRKPVLPKNGCFEPCNNSFSRYFVLSTLKQVLKKECSLFEVSLNNTLMIEIVSKYQLLLQTVKKYFPRTNNDCGNSKT